MTKIIRVEPAEPIISLTWMLGARCNYDCMYCPTEWHDSTSPHPDLDQLKQVWLSFYEKTKDKNLPYKITYTGGEVTANKSFLPMIEYLKSGNFNVGQIFVTTNGSASLRYYTELAKLVTGISFSTHSEFIEEQKFFNKVEAINRIMIRPERSVHVNIMNEFWNEDRIKLYRSWLDEKGISYSVNEINYNKQTRTIPLLQGTYDLKQI